MNRARSPDKKVNKKSNSLQGRHKKDERKEDKKMMETTSLRMEERAVELNRILNEMGAEFKVEFKENWKNNRLLKSYVLVDVTKKRNCSPVLYFSPEWYDKEDQEVAKYLDEVYQKYKVENVDVSRYMRRERIIEKILPRLVADTNIEKMEKEGIAYVRFYDMAIAFYQPVEEITTPEGVASITISNAMLEYAGIGKDEAVACAVKNMAETVEIEDMKEMIAKIMGVDIRAVRDVPDGMMYVISNKNRLNGAAAMLCPEVLKHLRERLGEKVAILPSSIHECIAIAYEDESDFETLRNMVETVNSEIVSVNEKLTDSVYIIKDGILCMAKK